MELVRSPYKVQPSPSPDFIYWLFNYRCVNCIIKPATEINEIIPRSNSKNSILDWKNRIPMCRECHDEFHKHGVNAERIAEYQEKRIRMLKIVGRIEYG